MDPGLASEDGSKFLTTPLGLVGAVLERVLVNEVIEVVRERAGHFGWATRAGVVGEALHPLGGKTMYPFAQRGIGKVQRVRDGLEALPFDDVTHSLSTAEDARLFGLFQEGV